jgi:hypothetical protein
MSGADVHCVDMPYDPTYVRTVLVVLRYDSNFSSVFHRVFAYFPRPE